MICLNFYERLSPAITDSQMLSLFPDFAALALQPELAASFSWAKAPCPYLFWCNFHIVLACLSMSLSFLPSLYSDGSMSHPSQYWSFHVQGLVKHRQSVWLQWKWMALLTYSQASWCLWLGSFTALWGCPGRRKGIMDGEGWVSCTSGPDSGTFLWNSSRIEEWPWHSTYLFSGSLNDGLPWWLRW